MSGPIQDTGTGHWPGMAKLWPVTVVRHHSWGLSAWGATEYYGHWLGLHIGPWWVLFGAMRPRLRLGDAAPAPAPDAWQAGALAMREKAAAYHDQAEARWRAFADSPDLRHRASVRAEVLEAAGRARIAAAAIRTLTLPPPPGAPSSETQAP